MGYDAARKGIQAGAGVTGCPFERTQSRGKVVEARTRHATSAGRIEASLDTYQAMVMRSGGEYDGRVLSDASDALDGWKLYDELGKAPGFR
jgi:hypothetical protein